jgi:copper chaperone CopZ
MLVDMTLQEMEGVAESKTDHATGVTVVSYDTDVVTADDIIQAIRRAGYDAELQD